jgi:predicted DNA-binding transcriptional regulator AlpA
VTKQRKATEFPPQHRIVLGRDLPELTGYRETALKEMVLAGTFPAPIKLGIRKLGWILAEVIAWQEARVAERDASITRQSAVLPRWKPNRPG